ncbi:[acyl-carrier-protein] S-malonyltransferase [Flaviaesturariibacter flavus]|uniref:Malonyl CoA-acyl carrier protein transacylase n=1 Tax=Flaviaesturariibacter flavus TaxID=2502780 RepID=A0A4R1BKL4_9BACT|nr:ACP S-malonyltransferase [Flaviaesturariibacter flavus]TCJ17859.1 [acyl-carrier-protein] S-malonyltransferase [Flaviaesturariibacter flavus]
MKHAFVFPGQGAQFPGMGKAHYDNNAFAKKLFEQANELLGFRISDVMFTGSEEDLKQTKITQPAIFLHSVIAFRSIEGARPEMVAGHSLGEFSALVANGTLSFEDGLRLVSLRAQAMQKACEQTPSTMAAVLGLDDAKVEAICAEVQQETGEVVVPANYNCPGQLVISGSMKGIEVACERLKAAGAKRALVLPVGGAFHSPLMEPARAELRQAIEAAYFNSPSCPVYQNVVAKGVIDKDEIKQNLIDQLTGPVRWTQCVQAMVADGASRFTECGPGKVLQGLIGKIHKEAVAESVS